MSLTSLFLGLWDKREPWSSDRLLSGKPVRSLRLSLCLSWDGLMSNFICLWVSLLSSGNEIKCYCLLFQLRCWEYCLISCPCRIKQELLAAVPVELQWIDKVTEIHWEGTSDTIKAGSSCASHIGATLASVWHSCKYREKCASSEQISLSTVLTHICIVL